MGWDLSLCHRPLHTFRSHRMTTLGELFSTRRANGPDASKARSLAPFPFRTANCTSLCHSIRILHDEFSSQPAPLGLCPMDNAALVVVCMEPMSKPHLTPEVVYLMEFLQDEFRNHPHVRIQAIQPSGTRRSPDLVQNYDTESNDLHTRQGVMVRAGSREHWFPVSLVHDKNYEEIRRLASRISEQL